MAPRTPHLCTPAAAAARRQQLASPPTATPAAVRPAATVTAAVGGTAAHGTAVVAGAAAQRAAGVFDATTAAPASTPRLQRPITAYFMEMEAPSAKRRRTLGSDAAHLLTAEQMARRPAPAAAPSADQTVQVPGLNGQAAAAAQLPPGAQCGVGLAALPAILPSALAAAASAAAARAATRDNQDPAGHTAAVQAAEPQPGRQQAQPADESDPIEDASLPAHMSVPAAHGVNGRTEVGQCYDEGNARAAAHTVQPRPQTLHCQETIGCDSGMAQCSCRQHETTSTRCSCSTFCELCRWLVWGTWGNLVILLSFTLCPCRAAIAAASAAGHPLQPRSAALCCGPCIQCIAGATTLLPAIWIP